MTYVTYTLYAVLAALFIWKMKYAGNSSFHTDATSLEVTKCLQGLIAVCVMFHHISQSTAFRVTGELSLFPNAGPLFVAIFFFCSGFGLIKSLQTKPGYLGSFLRNRLASILVPFYTMTIAYGIFFLTIGQEMPLMRWIASVTGLVLMNSHAWYPVVITLLYLAFYKIFSHIKNEKIAYTLMGLVILGQIVFCLCWGHLAWWAGEPYWWKSSTGQANAKWWMDGMVLWFQGEWWVNSTLALLVGMLYARFEKPVTKWIQKAFYLKWALLIILFVAAHWLSLYMQETVSYWTEFGPEKTLGIGAKFLCFGPQSLSALLFAVLMFVTMMKFRTVNPILKFLGNRTLEIYLMHNIFLMMGMPLIQKLPYGEGQPIVDPNHTNLMLYALIVLVGGIAFGCLFKWLNGKIIKKIVK